MVADILSLPHPDAVFDFAISVAVVHHLSTAERRVQAIAAILQTLAPSPVSSNAEGEEESSNNRGQALIYVWALEQKSSRRGWDKGDQQDVMVPWVLTGNRPAAAAAAAKPEQQVFHRYYHLYQEGELERDICAAGGRVVESGYEKDNWWAIASRTG